MDIRLSYVEKGKGETLILLHGNGESTDYFTNQLDEFSKHFRVIALDTRGHGNSPRGDGEFTIRRFAEDLKEFMDEKNIDRAHILGFSDGGNIAMCFALKYPERVDRLILNGANLFPKGVKASIQAPIVISYKLCGLISCCSLKARADEEMLGLMVNDPFIEPSELKKISAKTLVIAGTRDLIKSSHTRLIARSIDGAELRFIKGPHAVAARNPREFNRAVLAFLKKP